MGCDIHCYIEFRPAKREDGDEYAATWRPFGGDMGAGRDYDAFARIAGVRNYEGFVPVVEPRGFPKDAGYKSLNDNFLYVVEATEDMPELGDGECSREQAERWGGHYVDEERTRCFHPDWHSHTWLTTSEWTLATRGCDERYKAMTAAMRSLEGSGNEARVVIWFDN